MKSFIVVLIIAVLSGCSTTASRFSDLEVAREQARANAESNALDLMKTRYPESEVITAKPDNMQNTGCLQGSGWMVVELSPIERSATKPGIRLVCSTTSASLGCMSELEFRGNRVFAAKARTCDKEIPYPLPVI